MCVITIQEKSVTLSAINRSDTASTTTWMSTCRLLTNYPLLRLSNRIPFLARVLQAGDREDKDAPSCGTFLTLRPDNLLLVNMAPVEENVP